MNAYLWLAALVAFGLVTAGAYRQGRVDGRAACEVAKARDRQVAEIAADAAASAAASAIRSIKVQHTTIRQEVEREVRSNVVYRDCSHGPEQLQRINAALTGAEPASAADRGQLPAADTSHGPELRRDDAQADRGGGPLP